MAGYRSVGDRKASPFPETHRTQVLTSFFPGRYFGSSFCGLPTDPYYLPPFLNVTLTPPPYHHLPSIPPLRLPLPHLPHLRPQLQITSRIIVFLYNHPLSCLPLLLLDAPIRLWKIIFYQKRSRQLLSDLPYNSLSLSCLSRTGQLKLFTSFVPLFMVSHLVALRRISPGQSFSGDVHHREAQRPCPHDCLRIRAFISQLAPSPIPLFNCRTGRVCSQGP